MTHLTLKNISKEFSGTTVVQDFNLDVEQGEFVSFPALRAVVRQQHYA